MSVTILRRWPCKRMSCVMLLRLISIVLPFSSGLLGISWSFAWFALVYDSPMIHPSIDEEEKRIFDKDGSKILVASASVVWKRKMNLAVNTVTRYANTHAGVVFLNISPPPPHFHPLLFLCLVWTEGWVSPIVGFPSYLRILFTSLALFLKNKWRLFQKSIFVKVRF